MKIIPVSIDQNNVETNSKLSLYFPEMEFVWKKQEPNRTLEEAGMAAFQAVVGFIPILGDMFAVAGTVKSIDNLFKSDTLKRSFEDFLKSEKVTLNALTTRSGASVNFLVQKYSEDSTDKPSNHTLSSFLRVTPIGFGADIQSALTYALANREMRGNGLFDPKGLTSLEHNGIEHQLEYSTFLSIDLIFHKIRVTQLSDTIGIFNKAKATATTLGERLLEKFDFHADELTEIWKDYLGASTLVESIRDREIRTMIKTSNEANLRGFQRVKKLEDSYRKAAAAAKAAHMLSYLSQVLSFASSVQNYVEVRNAAKERQELENSRAETFNELSASLEKLQNQFTKQSDKISKLSRELSSTDTQNLLYLVPTDLITEFSRMHTENFASDTQLLSRPGPVFGDASGRATDSSIELSINSFRLNVSW